MNRNDVMKGLELEGRGGAALKITVIGNCRSFENIGWQKKLGNYKNDQPLFTKKRDFKTAKPERSFFLFLILLFNST